MEEQWMYVFISLFIMIFIIVNVLDGRLNSSNDSIPDDSNAGMKRTYTFWGHGDHGRTIIRKANRVPDFLFRRTFRQSYIYQKLKSKVFCCYNCLDRTLWEKFF